MPFGADALGEGPQAELAALSRSLQETAAHLDEGLALLRQAGAVIAPALDALADLSRTLRDIPTARRLADQAIAFRSPFHGRAVQRRGANGSTQLTVAEQEVAALAGEGLTNAEIAQQLYVSINTVKTHMTRVLAKLGIKSRRDLVRSAPDNRDR